MAKNRKRKSYFKLTYKEKQMINNIILKQEGYFSIFNISYMLVSVLLVIIALQQHKIILVFILIPIIYLILRLRLFYYYQTHTEINFDIDNEENEKLSNYTDSQLNFFKIGGIVIVVIMLIFIVIGLGIFNNDNSDTENNNGYTTKCYTREDGTKCCTSCKKTSYGDIGCSTTCD